MQSHVSKNKALLNNRSDQAHHGGVGLQEDSSLYRLMCVGTPEVPASLVDMLSASPLHVSIAD